MEILNPMTKLAVALNVNENLTAGEAAAMMITEISDLLDMAAAVGSDLQFATDIVAVVQKANPDTGLIDALIATGKNDQVAANVMSELLSASATVAAVTAR